MKSLDERKKNPEFSNFLKKKVKFQKTLFYLSIARIDPSLSLNLASRQASQVDDQPVWPPSEYSSVEWSSVEWSRVE